MDTDRSIELGSRNNIDSSFSGNQGRVVLNAHSIQARPLVTIFDDKRKEHYTIPLDLIDDLTRIVKSQSVEYIERRNVAQRETYNPLDLLPFKEHKTSKEAKYGIRSQGLKFSLEAHNSDEEMTPVIEWTPATYNFKAGTNVYQTVHYAGEIRGGYWSLYLNGEPEYILQTVRWDDEKNIEAMVESMTEPEALLVMLGLIDTDVASRLSARVTTVNIGKTKEFASVKLAIIRELIKSKDLGTKGIQHNNSFKAKLGTLYVKAENQEIGVAILVNPSLHSKFATYTNGKTHLDPYTGPQERDTLNAEKKVNGELWNQKFKEALAGTQWYVTDLSDEERLVITNISLESWAKVRLAAALALPWAVQTVRV